MAIHNANVKIRGLELRVPSELFIALGDRDADGIYTERDEGGDAAVAWRKLTQVLVGAAARQARALARTVELFEESDSSRWSIPFYGTSVGIDLATWKALGGAARFQHIPEQLRFLDETVNLAMLAFDSAVCQWPAPDGKCYRWGYGVYEGLARDISLDPAMSQLARDLSGISGFFRSAGVRDMILECLGWGCPDEDSVKVQSFLLAMEKISRSTLKSVMQRRLPHPAGIRQSVSANLVGTEYGNEIVVLNDRGDLTISVPYGVCETMDAPGGAPVAAMSCDHTPNIITITLAANVESFTWGSAPKGGGYRLEYTSKGDGKKQVVDFTPEKVKQMAIAALENDMTSLGRAATAAVNLVIRTSQDYKF